MTFQSIIFYVKVMQKLKRRNFTIFHVVQRSQLLLAAVLALLSLFFILAVNQVSYNIKKMEAKNLFRKSDMNMQNLDKFFLQDPSLQTRNSFSINRVTSLDFINSRVSLSHNCAPPQIPSPVKKTAKKIENTVKDRLSLIEEKIAKARQQLSSFNQKSKSKTAIKQKSQLNCAKIQEFGQNTSNFSKRIGEMPSDNIQKLTNVMPKPRNILPTLVNPYNTSKNNRYYLTEAVRAVNQKNSMAVEHIQSTIEILNYCTLMLYQIQQQAKKQPKIFIPINPSFSKRKTLILDLDQTLIHSTENTQIQPDLRLKVEMDDTFVTIDLNIRPYALTFLEKISKKWEVIVFTASTQTYANAILDQIDPEKDIIHHRLYRQHCTQVGELFVKDLSRLNRDLKNVVLVDNAAYSYILQLSNGIPILPYYDGKDYQLAALESYLQKLQNCGDVREKNKDYFMLQRYASFQNGKQLIEQLYINRKSQTFL